MSGVPKRNYAFPWVSSERGEMCPGMTMREYYAGLAMQGILADHEVFCGMEQSYEDFAQTIAGESVQLADALLAELAK